MEKKDQKRTLTGKIRAAYTLRCEFNDGNAFTYRSDDALAKLAARGYKNVNELDALILTFTGKKNLIQDGKIFDNRMPHGEDLLLHYSGMLGKIVINFLPKNYKL